jgi:polyisoprenoid-binding protein YceI
MSSLQVRQMNKTMRPGIFAALVVAVLSWEVPAAAQPPAGPAAGRTRRRGPFRGARPRPDETREAHSHHRSKARYKVREQLAGISFPSDAVGTTESVTGVIVVNPDGSLDATVSKITVDLKTLSSDQQMRDGYIQNRTLETAKYPTLEFVPKRVVGLPAGPLPATGQAGFQLVGDMTLHGSQRRPRGTSSRRSRTTRSRAAARRP